MYYSVINISIYSPSLTLEGHLRKMPELERFEHHFLTCDHLCLEAIEDSDLIIFDLPLSREALSWIYDKKPQDALVVLCAVPEEMSILTEKDYEQIYDIWVKPFDCDRFSFYFLKLQKQLKQTMDYDLNQKYLDTLIDSVPDLVWFKDKNGAHLKVNQSFCRTVDKTKEDIQGKHHCYIWDIPEEDFEKGEFVCQETERAVMESKKTILSDEIVKCKDGLRQLKTYKSPIFDMHNNVIGTVGIAHDVTDLCNMNAEIQTVLEHMPFAILFYDPKGIILNVNKRFTDYFKIDKEKMLGKDYESWELSLQPHFGGKSRKRDYEIKVCLNGQDKVFRVIKEAIRDIFDNVTGYFCIYTDVTMEHNWKEDIIHCANTDYLTGLYNRRYLYAYLTQHRQSKPLCLFYIDIDNFKLINDLYGHKYGDKALVYVSSYLTQQLPDHHIFRIGGDEFIVALSDECDPQCIKRHAQELLEGICNCAKDDPKLQGLSASIGIVIDDEPFIPIDDLIRRGDSALYIAKQRGKNQYCLWEGEQKEAADRIKK